MASARELFAADGIEASVEEITRHAGVGMGTLYRHFATKEELVDAVLEDAFGEIVAAAERGARRAGRLGRASRSFLEQALDAARGEPRRSRTCSRGRDHGLPTGARRCGRACGRCCGRLIERAQAQGTLRADFAPEDMPLVFWSGGRVIERDRGGRAGATGAATSGILLDGLRAEAATPLAAAAADAGRSSTRGRAAGASGERRPPATS